MTQAFLTQVTETLREIEGDGLWKTERPLTSPQGARITVDGKGMLNLCANNYLGLADHPRLIAA
ncbi:MAG: glycine C-acetyltransferase, partial [Albimonas sp.]